MEERFYRVARAMFLTFALVLVVLLAQSYAQTFQVLHTFHGPDGANPVAVLILDTAGNIYGTTEAGGVGKCTSEGCGTAFMLDRVGEEVALYSFNGSDGYQPMAGLLRDSKGTFFGTTVGGGSSRSACDGGCGVAFKLDRNGRQIEYRFQGTPDGMFPEALLVEDAARNLYGTTYLGGPNGLGAVFKIDATTGKENVLYSFTGGTDGCFPYPGVILDSLGNLYGVTLEGGDGFCNSGDGVVFKVDPNGNETVLHAFGGGDGANPESVLLFDSGGNLYGTTQNGGSSNECGFSGCGTVFELSPQQDGSWSENVLYSFCSLADCTDGERPLSGPLVRDSAGNLFGTTYFGGKNDDGVVFKLDAAGEETVLHTFTGGSDGADPFAGLVMDGSGALYGTTADGGTTCYTRYTCGVVFKITP